MFRSMGMMLAVAFAYAAVPAQAQVVIVPGGFLPLDPHAQLHANLAQRELERRQLHALAHRQGLTPREHALLHDMLRRQRATDRYQHDLYHYYQPPVVFLPPPTRAASDPFGGVPGGGNHYYWLSQQAARGNIPQSAVNKVMYPDRRTGR